jgi:hypothetical protein
MQGRTNLLTSWEEKHSEDGMFVIFGSGDPHTRATYEAVVDRFNAVSGRPKPTEDDLLALVGQKVTIVEHGTNMLGGGILIAQEGTIFVGMSGNVAIKPKGARTKGLRIDVKHLADVIDGYSTAEAERIAGDVRKHFPTLKPLTQERLNELPPSSNTLSLCVFGSYRMPDSTATDALYLVSNYMREDDIIEGVLLIREEHGFSESGSIWGRQLISGDFGEVVGFEPISFSEGLELCNVPFDEAYDQIIASKVAA